MKYVSVKVMEDLLPQDAWLWHELERLAREELEAYGYSEIRTPILEDTAVFVRSIGETTDIVTKEMFTFLDRKERSLTMRPEGTAPIVRAYVEHTLVNTASVLQLYYIGPMFRAERPQKGRLRQFHQIGVEIIGSRSTYSDAEVIQRLWQLLKSFGLDDAVIKLNSLGCKEDKERFASKLREYLNDRKSELCDDCKTRIDKNVFRSLDCKNEACKQVLSGAPNILDSLCEKCKTEYARLKSILSGLKVSFSEVKNLVRGLDYYTGTVFEVTHAALGAQDAIGAGGRYDNLVKDMGGPDAGAIGFALGIERIILAIKAKAPKSKGAAVVYVATLGDAAKLKGIELAEEIRGVLKGNMPSGFVVLKDIGETSLKSQLRNADKNGARLVVILGDDEISQGKAKLKDMVEKKEDEVAIDSIAGEIKRRLC